MTIVSKGTWRLALLPAAFISLFFLYPLWRILWIGFSAGAPELGGTGALIWFTTWQALVSTILTVAAALPLTAIISNFSFRGRDAVRTLVTVPFVMPTMVVATAFVAIGWTTSIWAILAAHVFYNLAVVVRTVGAVWSRLDRRPYEAARTLGAGRLRSFVAVTLPMLAPSLAAAATIVFLFCFTSFGVVLVLGGLRYRTLEVEIYQQAVTFLDLPSAAALSVIQLVGVAATMAAYSRIQRRSAQGLSLIPEAQRLRPLNGHRWSAGSVIILTLGLQLQPLVLLISRSLRGNGAGWRFLVDPGPLAVTPASAVRNSLVFAAITTAIALLVGGMAAWTIARRSGGISGLFDLALMLPLGTSAVTIGLGLLVALDRPIDLRGSWFMVPLAHSLVAVPFVVRAAVPALRSIRAELQEAAAVLGATPWRVWRTIELPLVARPLAVGAGFAAAVSLGEFGASSFVARPASATVPTLLYQLLGRPGFSSYSGALALAVVLMVLTGMVTLAADRGRLGELGGF